MTDRDVFFFVYTYSLPTTGVDTHDVFNPTTRTLVLFCLFVFLFFFFKLTGDRASVWCNGQQDYDDGGEQAAARGRQIRDRGGVRGQRVGIRRVDREGVSIAIAKGHGNYVGPGYSTVALQLQHRGPREN